MRMHVTIVQCCTDKIWVNRKIFHLKPYQTIANMNATFCDRILSMPPVCESVWSGYYFKVDAFGLGRIDVWTLNLFIWQCFACFEIVQWCYRIIWNVFQYKKPSKGYTTPAISIHSMAKQNYTFLFIYFESIAIDARPQQNQQTEIDKWDWKKYVDKGTEKMDLIDCRPSCIIIVLHTIFMNINIANA